MQHLDEGRIHAWLDGQLPREEAAEVEAHVAECRPCADAVAEARGLIAASSRILTALDAVPREVAPKPIVASESALPEGVLSLRREAPPNVDASQRQAPVSSTALRPRRRWFSAQTLAAAATIVVAVGVFSLYERDGVRLASDTVSQSAPAAADSAVAVSPTVAAPASTQSLGAGAAGNEARQEAPPARAQSVPQEADRSIVAAERMAFADSAPRNERRKVAEDRAADAFKRNELARVVPAPAQPETNTVTVIRGNSVAAPVAQAELAKASAGRADAAAVGSIRGRVTDANHTAIVGAMVQVAGTNTGIATNPQGEYSLGGVQAGGQRLVIDRPGYQSANRSVAVVQGQTVSADVILTPAPLALTADGAGSARERASNRAAAPTPAAPPPSQPRTLQNQSIAGCYEWTVTSTTAQQRTRFLQIPRRLALDTIVTPSSNDGIWYRARDLAGTAVLPNGLWRPIDSGVEVQWVVGAKTSTVRLTGSANAVMRGNIEEIDRSAGTGESGNVISMRRSCEG